MKLQLFRTVKGFLLTGTFLSMLSYQFSEMIIRKWWRKSLLEVLRVSNSGSCDLAVSVSLSCKFGFCWAVNFGFAKLWPTKKTASCAVPACWELEISVVLGVLRDSDKVVLFRLFNVLPNKPQHNCYVNRTWSHKFFLLDVYLFSSKENIFPWRHLCPCVLLGKERTALISRDAGFSFMRILCILYHFSPTSFVGGDLNTAPWPFTGNGGAQPFSQADFNIASELPLEIPILRAQVNGEHPGLKSAGVLRWSWCQPNELDHPIIFNFNPDPFLNVFLCWYLCG